MLGRGAYFGEMALLSDDRRRANRVEAESICDVYCLQKRDLDHIFTCAALPQHPTAAHARPRGC